MGKGLNIPLFFLKTFFIFLSCVPCSFSHARFARELADVFEKSEKKNKTTSVYRLTKISLAVFHVISVFKMMVKTTNFHRLIETVCDVFKIASLYAEQEKCSQALF